MTSGAPHPPWIINAAWAPAKLPFQTQRDAVAEESGPVTATIIMAPAGTKKVKKKFHMVILTCLHGSFETTARFRLCLCVRTFIKGNGVVDYTSCYRIAKCKSLKKTHKKNFCASF